MNKTLLNYEEARELLGIRLSTLYSMVCRHQIPHIRLSGRIVQFDPDELREWINERRVPVRERFTQRGRSYIECECEEKEGSN